MAAHWFKASLACINNTYQCTTLGRPNFFTHLFGLPVNRRWVWFFHINRKILMYARYSRGVFFYYFFRFYFVWWDALKIQSILFIETWFTDCIVSFVYPKHSSLWWWFFFLQLCRLFFSVSLSVWSAPHEGTLVQSVQNAAAVFHHPIGFVALEN